MAQRIVAEPGQHVLDLACGTVDLVDRIARDVPEAELEGVDLSSEMVVTAAPVST